MLENNPSYHQEVLRCTGLTYREFNSWDLWVDLTRMPTQIINLHVLFCVRLHHTLLAMDSMKIILVKQKCKEFLPLSSPEVSFLVDSSNCSNKISLTNARVEQLNIG